MTTSALKSTPSRRLLESELTTAISIIVPLIGYALPWVIGAGAALTMGGYDLAEWTTLIPASSAQTPPLMTALLLRQPLAVLGVTCAALAARAPSFASRLLWGSGWVALAAALLPPFELLDDPGNPNYRQQLGLALLTLMLGAPLFLPQIRRRVPLAWVGFIACVLSGGAALWGMANAYQRIDAYGLGISFAGGGCVCIAGLLVLGWRSLRGRQTR